MLEQIAALVLAGVCYWASKGVFRLSQRHVLALPVFVSVFLVLCACAVFGLNPSDFSERIHPLRTAMDAAVVAMAIPLHQVCRKLGPLLPHLLLGLLLASVISVAGVLVAGWMLDAPWLITAAVAPKAATMPVALSLAKSVGADQTILVTAVLLTGVVGTLLTPPLLRWLGVRDKRVQAFALGVSAHAIGLVRAQAEYPDHLDLAVAGMCGNALVTTILCSFLLFWTHG